MAHCVEPLAGMNWLVTVPPRRDAGCDALIPRHGADLVAVISLVAHQGRRPWKIPQQDSNTCEVAPLPLAEVKLHRTPLLVAHHMELAGHSPVRLGPINPGFSPSC